MPTYEYRCSACGHAFEKFHSIAAAPIKVCPQCGRKKVRRLVSTGAGLIFKGSGFYTTDYRSDSYKSAAKSEQPTAAAPASKTDAPAASGGPSAASPAPASSGKAATAKTAAPPSK